MSQDSMRCGLGYDIHRLVEGRALILGGVEIPHSRGLEGHSDGDAVLHAVADALLGAAGLPDIGEMFPDDDEAWRDADSSEILSRVCGEIQENGWTVLNLDMNVIAEEPRLQPYKEAMRSHIAGILAIDPGQVGLKARTREGLGAVGRGEAIEVHCMALICRDAG